MRNKMRRKSKLNWSRTKRRRKRRNEEEVVERGGGENRKDRKTEDVEEDKGRMKREMS
jgi:hypothetical protein